MIKWKVIEESENFIHLANDEKPMAMSDLEDLERVGLTVVTTHTHTVEVGRFVIFAVCRKRADFDKDKAVLVVR